MRHFLLSLCLRTDSGVSDSNLSHSCTVGILQKAQTPAPMFVPPSTAPLMTFTFVFICFLFVLRIFFFHNFIWYPQAHTHTHTHRLHNTLNDRTYTALGLITVITPSFYLQPNASLCSDTCRMFAIHPPHARTLLEKKQSISTTTSASHLLLQFLSHCHSLSLHLSLCVIAYLLIAFP